VEITFTSVPKIIDEFKSQIAQLLPRGLSAADKKKKTEKLAEFFGERLGLNHPYSDKMQLTLDWFRSSKMAVSLPSGTSYLQLIMVLFASGDYRPYCGTDASCKLNVKLGVEMMTKITWDAVDANSILSADEASRLIAGVFVDHRFRGPAVIRIRDAIRETWAAKGIEEGTPFGSVVMKEVCEVAFGALWRRIDAHVCLTEAAEKLDSVADIRQLDTAAVLMTRLQTEAADAFGNRARRRVDMGANSFSDSSSSPPQMSSESSFGSPVNALGSMRPPNNGPRVFLAAPAPAPVPAPAPAAAYPTYKQNKHTTNLLCQLSYDTSLYCGHCGKQNDDESCCETCERYVHNACLSVCRHATICEAADCSAVFNSVSYEQFSVEPNRTSKQSGQKRRR